MSKEKKSIAQNMGITRTVIRPREECDIQLREDRIGKYFKKYLNKFVFVEFSEDFMKKSKAGDLMRGVPIPLRKKEIKEFAGGEGIDMLVLAENMAWVMGCDPHFKYTKDYVAILKKLYNYKLYEGMMKEGRDAAERGVWTMPAFTSVRLYVCSTIICTACTVMQEPAEPCIFTAEMKNMLEDSRRNPWLV